MQRSDFDNRTHRPCVIAKPAQLGRCHPPPNVHARRRVAGYGLRVSCFRAQRLHSLRLEVLEFFGEHPLRMRFVRCRMGLRGRAVDSQLHHRRPLASDGARQPQDGVPHYRVAA